MKQGQFSQEQIIGILHQAEKGETTIQALCKEHGISEVTFYRWRKAYGGMTPSEASKLKQLEKENARPYQASTFSAGPEETLLAITSSNLS
jgi:putative transposase